MSTTFDERPELREQVPIDPQAVMVAEMASWVGVAVWGGALATLVAMDVARRYRHRGDAPHGRTHRHLIPGGGFRWKSHH
ncbi:hypothetical protein [Nocardioides alcanivorans]|uniref:hypothetical protein n=1 Tax=Nocardioides alcanivorans TaxID=2897352 RepID=UPI001F351586|nr:hypothetical protein [Nocardioides alcanivorans]